MAEEAIQDVVEPAGDEEGEVDNAQVLRRLTAAMEGIQNIGNRPVPPEPFRPPRYDGTGDMEHFIEKFTEMSDANGWAPAGAVIRLREWRPQTVADLHYCKQ